VRSQVPVQEVRKANVGEHSRKKGPTPGRLTGQSSADICPRFVSPSIKRTSSARTRRNERSSNTSSANLQKRHRDLESPTNPARKMVPAEGIGIFMRVENTQVIDFSRRQKRRKRKNCA
jgi:hypothetical protein